MATPYQRLQIVSVTMSGVIPVLSSNIATNTVGATDTIFFTGGVLTDGNGNAVSVAFPNYLPIVVDPNTAAAEIMWITSYGGGNSATVTRGAEAMTVGGTIASPPSHNTGAIFLHAPTPNDFALADIVSALYAWSNFS